MADNELSEVVSARLTPAEAEHAKTLGSGSASAGVRRSLRLSSTISGATTNGAARLSQLLEQALPLAHGLEQVAAADVVAATSGACWMPRPTAGLLLEFRRVAPGAVSGTGAALALGAPRSTPAQAASPTGSTCHCMVFSRASGMVPITLDRRTMSSSKLGAVAISSRSMATAFRTSSGDTP